jgi:hypothetical protein
MESLLILKGQRRASTSQPCPRPRYWPRRASSSHTRESRPRASRRRVSRPRASSLPRRAVMPAARASHTTPSHGARKPHCPPYVGSVGVHHLLHHASALAFPLPISRGRAAPAPSSQPSAARSMAPPSPSPRQSRSRARGSMAPNGDVALAPFNTGDVALPHRIRGGGSMAPTGDVALAPFNAGDVALPIFPTGPVVADTWRRPETSPLPLQHRIPLPCPLQHRIDRAIHRRVLHLPRLPKPFSWPQRRRAQLPFTASASPHRRPLPSPFNTGSTAPFTPASSTPASSTSLASLSHSLDRDDGEHNSPSPPPPHHVWPLHHPTVDPSVLPSTPDAALPPMGPLAPM